MATEGTDAGLAPIAWTGTRWAAWRRLRAKTLGGGGRPNEMQVRSHMQEGERGRRGLKAASASAMVAIDTVPQWHFLLAYPASRHPPIREAAFGRLIHKGGAASGRPPFVDTLMDGCLEAG